MSSKIRYTSSINYKPILAGVLVVALAAAGFMYVQNRRDVNTFAVVCPASSYSMAEKLTAAYTAQHPDVTMELNAMDDGECTAENIADMLDSGKADVAFLPAGICPADLEGVRLYDVRSIYHAASPQLAVASQAEAPLYALPLAGQADVLLYNPAMLEGTGEAAPRNWSEFFATLNFLDETGVTALRLESLEEDSFARLALLDACVTYGSAEIGMDAAADGSMNGGKDLYAQLMTYFAETEDACVPAVSHDRALTSFRKGGCAMVFATSAEYAQLKAEGVDCAAAPISGIFDEAHYAVTPTCSVAAAARVQGETADSFFAWLLQKDAQEIIADETGDFPMASGISESKTFPSLVVRADDAEHSVALLSSLWQAGSDDRRQCLTESLELKEMAA